jgi:hypothetical protein
LFDGDELIERRHLHGDNKFNLEIYCTNTFAIGNVVYGWLPDKPDKRALISARRRQKISVKRHAKLDLRPACSKVDEQNNLGCRTANAQAGAFGYLMIKDKVRFADIAGFYLPKRAG